MPKKKASELVSGEFVSLPKWSGTNLACWDFQGPVLVELNPDVPGNVLIQHRNGAYECEGSTLLEALPRPRFNGERLLNTEPGLLILQLSDTLIQSGWPRMAREQFLEQAMQGGVENLIHMVHEVFEAA
jgi:hypothetical protein